MAAASPTVPVQAEPALVGELLGRAATAVPAGTAVVAAGRRLGYAQLAEEVELVAAGLAAQGVAPGDAVALMTPPGSPSVLGLLGILRAGAVAVPMSPASKPAEIDFCLRDSGARLVLGEGPRALAVDDARAAGRHAPAAAGPAGPDADALFAYSAGATGRPKRVPRTHRQLVAEARAVVTATGLTPADTIFCALPLFHAYGLGCCLLAALHSGATLLFAGEDRRPFALDRTRVLGLLEQAGVTVFPAVPFHLRVLADAPGGADLSRLRLVLSAGNALPRATWEAFTAAFGVMPRQVYGCTEAGAVTANLDGDARATAGSVGRPLDGVAVAVVDPAGDPVEAERHGEVTIRSAAMTRGYAGAGEQNRTAFPGGAFLTGDRGRLDADGRLWLTGRRKRLIDVRGDKVDPVEVEDVLAVHPRVRDVVVLGAQSTVEGEELIKAVVVPDGPCAARELVRFCRERLADHKAPRIVEFREEIPRSPLGEVLRKYLV